MASDQTAPHPAPPIATVQAFRSVVTRSIGLCAVSLLWLGCGGDDLIAPVTGEIAVTTSTTGVPEDPDGYVVTLDGERAGAIDNNGTLTLTTTSGDHTLELGGLATNCMVEGGAVRDVRVAGGEVTTVTFEVVCVETSGALRVVTATSGPEPDPDGYSFRVDEGEPRPIGPDAAVTVTALPAGEHVVELLGVAENCELAGENPRAVTVTAGEVVELIFEISCVATVGTLEITTSTTGPGNGGYTVRVDEGPPQPIGPNDTVTVSDLEPGSRSVELAGLAPGCLVEGENPRPVEIVAGEAAAMEFLVVCTAGVQQWTPMVSGTNADLPDVWGSSATDVFVVGEVPIGDVFRIESVILHFDGNRWTQQLRQRDLVLRAVWGSSAADVFAVGLDFATTEAKVLHYDGTRWSNVPGFRGRDFEQLALLGIWGSSASDVFAVGSAFDGFFERSLIFHFDGSSWQRMPLPGPVAPALVDIWGTSSQDVYAVGRNDEASPATAVILHYDGATWRPVFEEEDLALTSVWASSASDVFATGFRIEEDDDEFRVFGTILHYDGRRWSAMEIPESGILNGIWGTSASDVFAVGEDGIILHYDGSGWSRTNPTTSELLSVWGSSPGDVFAVGNGGTILHGTP